MTTNDSGVFTLANAPTEPPAPATDADHLSDARAALAAARTALGHVREELSAAARCIDRSRTVTGADRCAANARHELGNADAWINQAIVDLDTLLSPRGV